MGIKALTLAAALAACHAVPLPGSAPQDYASGQEVAMFVNKIWSSKTQLPYTYYSLPFCRPEVIETQKENIGQIILGDRIQTSDYKLFMGKETRCAFLCEKSYSEEDAGLFTERIDQDYTVNWYLDGLPAVVRLYEEGAAVGDESALHYEKGFPLGFYLPPAGTADADTPRKHFLFNHIQLIVHYHQEDGKAEADPAEASSKDADGPVYRIVGFEVEPASVKHVKADPAKGWDNNFKTCSVDKGLASDVEPLAIDSPTDVAFTYDVVWKPSDVPWANRWDLYLNNSGEDDIHVFAILNSLMVALFLTGMVAMILVRNLWRDIARYNEEVSQEEAQEDSGWKLVHGDVFRPPAGFFGPMFLSVFVGSGAQVLAMAVSLLVFAVMGFLSLANQGVLVTAFIVLFVFMGFVAGYFSSRLYKMFKGKARKRNATLTAFAFPGALLSIAVAINIIVGSQKSSMTIPIPTILLLFALWLFISVPLVAAGAWLGFRAEEVKHPVRVNNIPRQVPPQPFYLHPVLSVLVGGVLPFVSIFIELYFVMSALWSGQVYDVFGYLFAVLLILMVTCAEISIVMTYFQLCSEDYNWWWRSFLTAGSSALYLLIYSVVYFYTKLEITLAVSTVIYFGYMAMIAWVFFLMTGSIGFVASLIFVNKIYGAIKVD